MRLPDERRSENVMDAAVDDQHVHVSAGLPIQHGRQVRAGLGNEEPAAAKDSEAPGDKAPAAEAPGTPSTGGEPTFEPVEIPEGAPVDAGAQAAQGLIDAAAIKLTAPGGGAR